MTEEKPVTGRLESKFWKVFMIIVAAVLVFAGPTYVVYVLQRIAAVDYVISVASGLALFIVGLVLLWYLIRNNVLS